MKLASSWALFFVFSGLIFLFSCSTGSNPVDPMSLQNLIDTGIPQDGISVEESNRNIIAVYEAVIDPVAQTFTLNPCERQSNFHFPLTNLYPNVVSITGVGFTPSFWADIRLNHPFPGSGINAYDPRVIAVLPANAGVSMNYPVLNVTANNSVIISPDGYTKLFDNTGVAGNTNPFMAYFKTQPYRIWSSSGTTSETRRWDMNINGFGGPIVYYLVVDVSTNFPNPPQVIIDNAVEPVEISAVVGMDLTDAGNSTTVTATLLDWQGSSGIGGVKVESPSLFTGLATLNYTGPGIDPDTYIYSGTISNSKFAAQGWYKLLISTWDQLSGTTMYREYPVYVDSEIEFDISEATPAKLNFTPQGVFCSGSYAYVAGGYNGLHIFNITTPSNPTWVGRYDTAGYAYEVVVKNSYAYVADGTSGIQVINVTTPSAPTLVKTVDTPGTAYAVAITEWMLLVADGTGGFHIIDINSPSTAYILKTVSMPASALDVDANDNRVACVACQSSGVQIIDLTNPGSSAIVDTLTASPRRLTINGNYLYYTNSYALYSADISDPYNAVNLDSLGFYPQPEPWGLDADSGYLYIGQGHSYFTIVNISNPADLIQVKQITIPGEPRSVFISGGIAFIANTYQGLQVIDITPPESAYLVKTVESPVFPVRVVESNGYLYVSDESNNGVRILDVNPVNNSRIVSSFPTTYGLASEVEIKYPYAFIADRWGGVWVASIEPPESPGIVQTVPCTDESAAIQIVGDRAFVTDNSNGLMVLDVSSPEDTYQVTGFDTDGTINDVHVEGDYAFLMDSTYGLYIYDINPIDTPTLVKSIEVPGTSPSAIEYMNGYVLVANRNYGVEIVDVDPPGTASIVKTVDTPGSALRMHIVDGYAFVADNYSGVQIMDVYPPEAAHIVTTIPPINWTFDVYVSDNKLFIAEPGVGIRIFELW